MREAGIGRVLVASLHQGIADILPTRLGFYAAAFTRLLTLFNMHARAEVVACRGTGEPTCVLKVAMLNGQAREDPPK